MSEEVYITDDMLTAFEGLSPTTIASASADGIPNVTYLSQVYYVDRQHLALSRQFFNKTIRNISENPVVCVIVICPLKMAIFKIRMRFVASQTSGDLFANMKLQLEVIASMQGQTNVFNLVAADIYKVLRIESVYAKAE